MATPFDAVRWGPVGWRGLPPVQPPNQIGAYGESILSQYPARWEGAQLFGGVQGLRSGWVVPSTSALPIWQQTQNPANVPGGQRYGKLYTAGRGPIALARQRAALLAAQMGYTGLPNDQAANLVALANSLPAG